MTTIDIIILVVIGVGVIQGLMKGFVKQLASIVGLIAGLLVARALFASVAEKLAPVLGTSTVIAQILAFVLIWVAVPLGFVLVASFLTKALDAVRLGWFKVYRPREFYAVYFTSRGDDFDANTAILGPAAVKQKILSLTAKGNDISQKESDQLETLQVTYEMLLRGIELLPVDLYQSDATLYRLEGDKLRLPFTALKGLGAAAATSLAEAGKKGPYLSIDDLTTRAGVSKTVIDLLREHGSLTSLPESSQISFFG